MSEVAQRYRVVAGGFTALVEGVASDGWSVVTPDWTVTDLVVHVTMTHRRVIATLDGTDPADVGPDAELAPQWLAATAAIRLSMMRPGRRSS
jgi:hypothetical protein